TQPLDPRGRCHLAGSKPQASGRVTGSVEDAQRHEFADQFRVHPRGGDEVVQVKFRGTDDGVGHSRLLGSKSDTAASCSSRSRSPSVGRGGTMILASANKSPGSPLVLGSPRPRKRSRRPHEVPAGTLTLASPPGVGTATAVP